MSTIEQIADSLIETINGLSAADQTKFFGRIRATKGDTTKLSGVSVREALRKSGMHPEYVDRAVLALTEAGLLDHEPGAILASARNVEPIVMSQAIAAARRIGVKPDEKGKLDVVGLNGALAASGLDPLQRITTKALLAQAGLID